MVKVNWDKRPIKRFVRDLVASFCGKGKLNALLFPADHAKDVLALKASGVVNGLTTLTLVEKSPENMTKALRVISRNKMGKCKGRKPFAWRNLMHLLPALTKALDFAWFDYCGMFKACEAEWTKANAPKFMGTGSDVLFTFQAVLRGTKNTYFARVEEETSETDIAREITATGPVQTMHVADDGSIYNVPATPYMLRALAIRRIGIRKLLDGWTFALSHITYKDRDPDSQDDRGPAMILLHLSDIKPV